MGVAPDVCKACRWYQKASDLGAAEGQVDLGICYQQGISCESESGTRLFSQDGCAATRLYKAAAEKGNVQGLYNLGLSLKYGYCAGQKDLNEAKQYLERAANGGSQAARRELERIAPESRR